MSLELAENPANRPADALVASVQTRRDFATRFGPGNRANPTGRPKSAILRRKLLRQLRTEIAAGTDQADCVADAIIQKAISEGDVTAATFIRDTVDGKPQAASDDSEAPRISIAIDIIGTVNVGK